jgi:hypothetical protein
MTKVGFASLVSACSPVKELGTLKKQKMQQQQN